ncbi:MAG: hypothetical protein V1790_01840, partial [Planctomycetota bacterium]
MRRRFDRSMLLVITSVICMGLGGRSGRLAVLALADAGAPPGPVGAQESTGSVSAPTSWANEPDDVASKDGTASPKVDVPAALEPEDSRGLVSL